MISSFMLASGCSEPRGEQPSAAMAGKAGREAKGKLFIIGGGSRPQPMIKRIIREAGLEDGGYGVILPMASSYPPDTTYYYSGRQFRQAGIDRIYGLNFKKGETPPAARLDSLRKARMIYISGGVQSRFMDVVRGTPIEKALEEAYQNGALVAGTSAGAAVMSRIMITGDQQKYPEYTPTFYHIEDDNLVTDEGLGMITGVIIDQHFVKRARNNRLLTAIMEYPDHIGIGIDESTAILVQGHTAEVVGESQVLVYRNKSGKPNEFNGKMGVHDIGLGIYLPGEKFSIK